MIGRDDYRAPLRMSVLASDRCSPYERFGKRMLDFAMALAATAVLAPLMLLVALAIVIDDGGPPLFNQRRVGRYGAPFTLIKFRSMPVATPDLPSSAASGLPVTRVGRIIRRTNIDELPQLLNVIKGDMSIVGPRPPLFAQERLVALRAEAGVNRLRPGVTGLAQIHGYTGMPDEEKTSWDLQYLCNLSLLNDIVIIFRTIGYLRRPPPIY